MQLFLLFSNASTQANLIFQPSVDLAVKAVAENGANDNKQLPTVIQLKRPCIKENNFTQITQTSDDTNTKTNLKLASGVSAAVMALVQP